MARVKKSNVVEFRAKEVEIHWLEEIVVEGYKNCLPFDTVHNQLLLNFVGGLDYIMSDEVEESQKLTLINKLRQGYEQASKLMLEFI
jgi:hypothetical protein